MFDNKLRMQVQKILKSSNTAPQAKGRLYTILTTYNYKKSVDVDDISFNVIGVGGNNIAVPGNLITALLLIGVIVDKKELQYDDEKDTEHYFVDNKDYSFDNTDQQFEIFCG